MQHDVFIGQVQHRAQLPSRGDAEHVTRVVLETLSEQVGAGAARHLAAQLPPEIGRHLIGAVEAGRLSVEQFFERVGMRERVPLDRAKQHVFAVMDTVAAAVAQGALDHVRVQLPRGYDELFAVPGGVAERLDRTGS